MFAYSYTTSCIYLLFDVLFHYLSFIQSSIQLIHLLIKSITINFSSHLGIESFSMVFTAGGEKGGIRGIFGVQIAYLNTDNRQEK